MRNVVAARGNIAAYEQPTTRHCASEFQSEETVEKSKNKNPFGTGIDLHLRNISRLTKFFSSPTVFRERVISTISTINKHNTRRIQRRPSELSQFTLVPDNVLRTERPIKIIEKLEIRRRRRRREYRGIIISTSGRAPPRRSDGVIGTVARSDKKRSTSDGIYNNFDARPVAADWRVHSSS